jgi:hypothetical protein
MKRLLLLSIAVASLACAQGTDVGRNGAVQVSFATRAVPVTPAAHVTLGANLLSDTLVVGTDTLILDSVEVVLKQVELKRQATPDCVPSGEDDPCEEFAIGPVLVSLPLTVGAAQQFALDNVPAGTYTAMEFDVHKPDDGNPQDQAFIAANPDFARISIRVRGTFNGTAFVYTTDLDVEQKLQLTPALVVQDGASTNITVFVDVRTWFSEGTALLDPATANPGGVNEGAVKENIKNSFRAFEDRDRDGSGD